VELAGDADITGSESLHNVLEAEIRKRPGLLVLELSRLRYMDSVALQAIVWANQALRKDGGRLALVGPHATVAQVLHMTEIDRLVPVYPSVAAATSG
jgi:anti-sigma B factor antagonist